METRFLERQVTFRATPKAVIAVILDIDFVIFTATLDGSHECHAKGSLSGGNTLNGFRHLLSVPCCNVNAKTACAHCQAGLCERTCVCWMRWMSRLLSA